MEPSSSTVGSSELSSGPSRRIWKQQISTPTFRKRKLSQNSRSLSGTSSSSKKSKKGYFEENRQINMDVININCLIDGCKRVFVDKSELIPHMAEIHKVGKFWCRVVGCNKSFDIQ